MGSNLSKIVLEFLGQLYKSVTAEIDHDTELPLAAAKGPHFLCLKTQDVVSALNASVFPDENLPACCCASEESTKMRVWLPFLQRKNLARCKTWPVVLTAFSINLFQHQCFFSFDWGIGNSKVHEFTWSGASLPCTSCSTHG